MNTQSLASVLMADSGSKVCEELEDIMFRTVLSENMNSIVDGGSE